MHIDRVNIILMFTKLSNFTLHVPNCQFCTDTIVNQEEDILPSLKELLCIPKNKEFKNVFHEVRTRYSEEKRIFTDRKVQYEQDIENILRFMAAASLDRNDDDH